MFTLLILVLCFPPFCLFQRCEPVQISQIHWSHCVTGNSSFAAHSKEPFQDKENTSPHLELLPPTLGARQSVQPTLQTCPCLSRFLTTKLANQCCSDFSWQHNSRLRKPSVTSEPKNEEAEGVVSRRGIFLQSQWCSLSHTQQSVLGAEGIGCTTAVKAGRNKDKPSV